MTCLIAVEEGSMSDAVTVRAETIETIDCLYRLRANGYSLICWSTINGWVAINYDVEDGNHADIKAFCYSDASILEEYYNKGYFDE